MSKIFKIEKVQKDPRKKAKKQLADFSELLTLVNPPKIRINYANSKNLAKELIFKKYGNSFVSKIPDFFY